MRTVKIRATLMRCGRCGKPYRNPLTHVCVTRLDRKPRRGKTKLAPKVRLSFGKCATCKKEITSWPHTCTVKTDFAKRKAEAGKQRKAEARKKRRRLNEHPPASECQDEDCPRYPCVQARIAYQKGYAAGHASGYSAGHADGYSEGHQAGYAAGQAAAG